MESKAAFFFFSLVLTVVKLLDQPHLLAAMAQNSGASPKKMNAEKNGTHIKDEGRP